LEPEKEPSSSSQNYPERHGLLYILFSVFGFFLGRSFSQSHSSTQEHVDTIRQTSETESQKRDENKRANVTVRDTEDVIRERRAEADRQYRIHNSIRKATWFAFLAATIYAGITLFIWGEMQKQTRIQRETYVASQRPWVKIKHRIVKPLTFNTPAWQGPAASMTIEDTLENVGQTVALDVTSWEDIIPLDPNPAGFAKTAYKRRSEWCDANRHPDPRSLPGAMLFPKDPMLQRSTVGQKMETVMKAANDKYFSGKVEFALVGCVAYRSSFESKSSPTHQTRFFYLLGRVNEGGGFNPSIVPEGVANDLQLISMDEGFSAD
jgi:hypothetical protein